MGQPARIEFNGKSGCNDGSGYPGVQGGDLRIVPIVFLGIPGISAGLPDFDLTRGKARVCLNRRGKGKGQGEGTRGRDKGIRGPKMPGVVNKTTVLRHPFLMFRLCGLRGVVRVLLAKRGVPFLTILAAVHRI